jgi:hypothetical protein
MSERRLCSSVSRSSTPRCLIFVTAPASGLWNEPPSSDDDDGDSGDSTSRQGSGAADARALAESFQAGRRRRRRRRPRRLSWARFGSTIPHRKKKSVVVGSICCPVGCCCTCRFGAGASGRSERVVSYAVRASGCTKCVAWLPEEQYHLLSQSEKRADGQGWISSPP